jgi:hypothetical protein
MSGPLPVRALTVGTNIVLRKNLNFKLRLRLGSEAGT